METGLSLAEKWEAVMLVSVLVLSSVGTNLYFRWRGRDKDW
ncbi:MAG: hypothetical protein QG665_308 [Patescibacteria group bacterium]|nr:hypothetical protein [Patescibacteria group bacterium]